MGSFGETVASLLDTYGRCLTLLRGLRGSRPSNAQSQLGSSVKSDRTKVRRAYSSGVSRRGSTFEKGDAIARSSLRRVITKLTGTLRKLMRTFSSSSHGNTVDYASLTSLSNASRSDALRTMSDLSSRLSSESRTRTRSRRTQATRKTKPHETTDSALRGESKSRRGRSKTASTSSHTKSKNDTPKRRKSASTDGQRPKGPGPRRRSRRPSAPGFADKRFSILTTSSASTKIGEIRRRIDNELGNIRDVRVVYPLHKHSFEGEPKAKRRRWGLFR